MIRRHVTLSVVVTHLIGIWDKAVQLLGETLENTLLQQSLKTYFQVVGDALIKRDSHKQNEQIDNDLLLSAEALQWLTDQTTIASENNKVLSAELLKLLPSDIETIAPTIYEYINEHTDSLTTASLRAFILSAEHVGTAQAELQRLFRPLSGIHKATI